MIAIWLLWASKEELDFDSTSAEQISIITHNLLWHLGQVNVELWYQKRKICQIWRLRDFSTTSTGHLSDFAFLLSVIAVGNDDRLSRAEWS